MKIVVTGIGVVSALGLGVEENFKKLCSEACAIGQIELLDTHYKNQFPAGEIKYSNAELEKLANVSACDKQPRTTLLAFLAAHEALEVAKIGSNLRNRMAVIGGTTVGGMDRTEVFYRTKIDGGAFVKTHSCGYTTSEVASFFGISGITTTLNTACSSSANAIIHGAQLIRHGYVDRALVGGFDALSKFTINGFNTLHILSDELCTPFDQQRKGLNLGEGAGFLVIESESSAKARKIKILAELSGYANANDAHHVTASSADGLGAKLCISKALQQANLAPADIDYINAHGTGTENNDLSEAVALKDVFGVNIPAFSSTKSYTGHTLGAAGGVEAVYSVLALQNQTAYRNLRFTNRMDEIHLAPLAKTLRSLPINHVLSNSFGFGGNDTSLIFSKV